MAPIAHNPVFNFNVVETETPMSRTHQYRKVMKPLLERKRRARINNCLDELKDLMVDAIQAEGESITKLEKADVLELTVRHLQKLKRQDKLQASPALDADRYHSGFTACANEVSRYLSAVPGVSLQFGTGLMSHLGNTVTNMDKNTSPLSVNTVTSSLKQQLQLSPISDGGYNSGRESASPALSVGCPSPRPVQFQQESSAGVWRPF